ncbi:hypothetical protein [Galbibacter sp. BG1]
MFRPNQTGRLHRLEGRDIYSRPTYADPIDCPFAPVSLSVKTDKTNVRADSSASRGSADELIARTRILIIPQIKPNFDDLFDFDGTHYRIVAIHPRYTITGEMDHYEADLEVQPQ